MLSHTTYTLAAKLAKGLDIGIKQVAICSGDHLLGKIKEKGFSKKEGRAYRSGQDGAESVDERHGGKYGYENTAPSTREIKAGFKDLLPVMSLQKNTLSVNKERTRITPARQGMFIDVDPITGKGLKLKILPVTVNYSATILFSDSEDLDKGEISLLWWMEDGSQTFIPLKVKLEGVEFELPVEVKPSSFSGQEFSRNLEYSWESAKMYRTDFSLDVSTFVLKSEQVPIIKEINFKIIADSDILVGEKVIDIPYE